MPAENERCWGLTVCPHRSTDRKREREKGQTEEKKEETAKPPITFLLF